MYYWELTQREFSKGLTKSQKPILWSYFDQLKEEAKSAIKRFSSCNIQELEKLLAVDIKFQLLHFWLEGAKTSIEDEQEVVNVIESEYARYLSECFTFDVSETERKYSLFHKIK